MTGKTSFVLVLVEIKEIQAKTALNNKSDKVSYKLKARVEEKK